MKYFTFLFVFISGFSRAQQQTNSNLWEASIAVQYSIGKSVHAVSSSDGVTETVKPKVGWFFAIRRHLNPFSKIILEPGVALSSYAYHKTRNYPPTYTFLPRIASDDFMYLFASLDNRVLVNAIHFKRCSVLPFAGISMNVLLDSKNKSEVENNGTTVVYQNWTEYEDQINFSYQLGVKLIMPIKQHGISATFSYNHFLKEQFSPSPPGRMLRSIGLGFGFRF